MKVGPDGSALSGYPIGSVFEGGVGDDVLIGSRAKDTSVFARNDGRDVIQSDGGNDLLQFGNGIDHDQQWFSRDSNDLIVRVIGNEGQARTVDWYPGPLNQIGRIQSDDDFLLLQDMAAFAPPAAGELELTPELASEIAPILAANWQSAWARWSAPQTQNEPNDCETRN